MLEGHHCGPASGQHASRCQGLQRADRQATDAPAKLTKGWLGKSSTAGLRQKDWQGNFLKKMLMHCSCWRSKARDIQRPKKLTSDAHVTYQEAFNRVFYTRYKEGRVEYEQINHSKTGRYNYIMERVWNTLRERIKIMRGFKASWSAKLLIDGFFIWYNFVRPHMTLKCSPAEMVGLKEKNWVGLIGM